MGKAIGIGSNKRQKASFSLVFIALTMSACATTEGVGSDVAMSKSDPYESFNRDIHGFNDSVDTYVGEPLADAYKWATPEFMQTGVSNFFNNLKDIDVVINDILQAKFLQGSHDFGRFFMNTTVGVGGLFDVAKTVGLEQHDEDFDQTLAVWGVPSGPYLVLPILGPTTVRGIPGAIFDAAANPSNYVGAPVQLLNMLSKRANAQSLIDASKEGAIDPYVFQREGFLQSREFLVSDGKSQHSADIDSDITESDLDAAGSLAGAAKAPQGAAKAGTGSKASYALRLDSEGAGLERASQSTGEAASAMDVNSKLNGSTVSELEKRIEARKMLKKSIKQ